MSEPAPELRDRLRGALLGLAVGDAVGTTLEFRAPGSFEPITDMVGGGPFRLEPGEWTDDTSMALCLGESLVARGGFDALDQMRRYTRWLFEGECSPRGRAVDCGLTVGDAIRRFGETGDPLAGLTDPQKAGNGCIMRLAPVAIFYHRDPDTAIRFAAESSRTTHGTAECLDACRLLAAHLLRAFAGVTRAELLAPLPLDAPLSPRLAASARGEYRDRPRDEIHGSGYVVDCLEAALWCFAASEDFESAILAAANLGDDADTTAAVCGQLAGAHYGASGIPVHWLERLVWRARIRELADALATGAVG